MANQLADTQKLWDKQMVPILGPRFLLRKLIPLNKELSKGGLGTTTVDVLKASAMSGGTVSMEIPSRMDDTLDPTVYSIEVPVLVKNYTMGRRTWESYINKGIQIDNALNMEAAKRVQIEEETMGMLAWKDQPGTGVIQNGIYNGAGNDYSTSKDFATYGNAKDAVAGAKALLKEDYVHGPYNLILATTQYEQLDSSESTTGSEEWKKVERQLGGGQIFESSILAAGTGLIMPTFANMAQYADLVNPFKMQTILGYDSKNEKTANIYGQVIEAMALRILNDVAFCKLSAI